MVVGGPWLHVPEYSLAVTGLGWNLSCAWIRSVTLGRGFAKLLV